MIAINNSYAGIGLLLIALSIPLILGKVRPNVWYGFRIRLTLENPDIWYPVNARGGRQTCILGAALIIVALAALLIPEVLLPWYHVAITIMLIVAVSLMLVSGIRYARQLDRGRE